MDIRLNEQSPLVFHRIRRNSHKTQGIPLARGISSDGIGSPTDHAYAPPGVVTKLDSICQRKQSQPSLKKMICTNCNQKTNCYCKKCTLEKLKLYSRKENLFLRSEEKEKLQVEILAAVEQKALILAQYALTQEKLIELKRKVENAKMRTELKRDAVAVLDGIKPTSASQFQSVFASQERHIDRAKMKKGLYSDALADQERTLAKIRYQYCLAACRLFPVQEFDVKSESVEPSSKNSSKNWAVVNEKVEEGRIVMIRNGYINQNLLAKLSASLSNGTVCLPSKLHPPFAAFTNTLQLVHLFNVIFNFRPPTQLSHREICIKDRWTKEAISEDWFILCDSVAYLCGYVGMTPSKLQYHLPHTNLMDFGSFVIGTGDIQKIGSKPAADIAEVRRVIFAQRPELGERKEEEDESWIIVD